MITLLLYGLAGLTVFFIAVWTLHLRKPGAASGGVVPSVGQLGIGFLANFLDTLGIGSFATTTSMFKFGRVAEDGDIPGTLNVGHTLPTIVEAFLFLGAVAVSGVTLVSMIAAAVAGAWVGAGIVTRLPQQKIRIGLGCCLLVAAGLMFASMQHLLPGGGTALGLTGGRLAAGITGNFLLGALMPLGIGLYAPCMILVYLLGMTPLAAFPIMMGSCAFLMPVGSVQFLKHRRYNLRAALGLALGGIPGVLVAFYVVKSLPLNQLRWLVMVVVLYTAVMLLRSALQTRAAHAAAAE